MGEDGPDPGNSDYLDCLDAAAELLDEVRQEMVECLAAARYRGKSGSVGFDFHFQDGDYKRARAKSDFGLS